MRLGFLAELSDTYELSFFYQEEKLGSKPLELTLCLTLGNGFLLKKNTIK